MRLMLINFLFALFVVCQAVPAWADAVEVDTPQAEEDEGIDELLAEFVRVLPPLGKTVYMTDNPVTVVTEGKPFDLSVFVAKPGVLAVVHVSQSGDVTVVRGKRELKAGRVGLWGAVGMDAPSASQPYGYDFVAVIHRPAGEIAAGQSVPAMESIAHNSDDLRPRLAAIAKELKTGSATSVFHVIETRPIATRALQIKRPAKPIWIPGVKG